MSETTRSGATTELTAGGLTLAPGGILRRGEHWTTALNRNQNLLGKVMLVANRPVERVTELTAAEWADLHSEMRKVTSALVGAFQPDHFNYAFLQNQDRQVHLHVIPRYAAARTFAGLVFADPDYPDHYAVPAPVRIVDPDIRDALAELLRGLLRTHSRVV